MICKLTHIITNEYSTGVDTYKTDISSFTTNDYAAPMVETADVTNITATSAQCGGEVTDDGGLEITAKGVCWSTQHNPTTSNQHTSDGNGLGTFASTITGLTQNEKYYVRAYATNTKGTSYGDQKEMTTIEGLPSVTTNSITNITAISAVSGGNVTSDSGYNVIERGVCWSTNQNPTIDDPHTSNGNGTGTFTSNITGLSNNTKYYVRAYATNSNGTNYGDQKELTTIDGLPIVTTKNITNITQTSATCGGNVTADGGFVVTARGVCWSTTPNPTISDQCTTNGNGTGIFTSSISGLSSNTTYYVRAYATNSNGTSYGSQEEMTTLQQAPEGAIDGMFSVSATNKVWFSMGNLQYQASTNTWRFAENQYDYVGSGNSNISSSYNGRIDLFGWATSGWDCGNQFFYPYNYESESAANFGRSYGPPCECNLTGDYKYSDWGVFNRISNGGNESEMWQTLSPGEWQYLLNNRYKAAQKKSQGTVNGVHGLILLPDEWTLPSGCSFYSQSNNWTTNNYTTETWGLMESAGAVFLPAAGVRNNKSVMFANESGHYWTTSYSYSTSNGGDLGFDDDDVFDHRYARYYGLSVRLVHFK